MVKQLLGIMVVFLLCGTNLYAADGDLVVNGNLSVGAPLDSAIKLVANGGLRVNSNGGTQLVLESTTSAQSAQVAFIKAGSWKWMMGVDGSSDSLTVYDLTGNRHAIYAAPNGNFFFFPNGGGNVGIGGWSVGTYKLYVSGSSYATSGWYSSDVKFKEDIAPIESALSKVLNIKGVSFNWKTREYKEKGFPEGRHYGVVAQDLEKVLPEIVKTVKVKLNDSDLEEEEKAVAYSEIIPILIEALKEQQQKIVKLEADVEALKTKQ